MTIEKRETELTQAYFTRFDELFTIQQFFVMSHQDVRKSGYPDRSVHGFGRSSYWEFKHATPNFSSPNLQEITCCRLARHTFCRYVIFFEHRDELKTLIAHPLDVFQKKGKMKDIKTTLSFVGHNFDELAAFMYSLHVPNVTSRNLGVTLVNA